MGGILVFFVFFGRIGMADVFFVKQDARGLNHSKDWQNAYTDLQEALEVAKKGDRIWVALGTYYPTSIKDPNETFAVPSEVVLLGGFKGNELEEKTRNFIENKTILSGNLSKDKMENSKHVVTLKGDGAVVDGFVIEGGRAIPDKGLTSPKKGHTDPQAIIEGSQESVGGGILMFNHAGIIKNCLVRSNEAGKGGGAYNMARGKIPIFINVVFENNIAHMRGGGISNDLGTNPLLIQCSFRKNICKAKGGAIYNDFGSSPLLVHCHFTKNEAIRAAAIGSDGSSKLILVGTSIRDNIAQDVGAGLYQGSYNANISKAANKMVIIESAIYDNKSLTKGPEIFIWGENKYEFYNSTVPSWPWSISISVPDKYAFLASLVERFQRGKERELSSKELKKVLNWVPKTIFSKKDKKLFEIKTAEQSRTLKIPKRVVYVNQMNKGRKNGQKISWDHSFADLQEAIEYISQKGGGQIWVAKGKYFPQNRERSFIMRPNVAIYGGFVGNEEKLSQRDFQKNPTILSGYKGESRHVVIGSQNSLIDGFIIEGGNASGEGKEGYGGGLFMMGPEQASNVANTLFRFNHAYYGGGIYAFNNVMSDLHQVILENNTAVMGAGMYLCFGSNVQFKKGVIRRNHASSRGGGVVVNYGSNPVFEKTKFSLNQSDGNGGAVWVDHQASQFGKTIPTFKECQFIGNQAVYYGGAIDIFNQSKAIFKHIIFEKNRARWGENIYPKQPLKPFP